MDKVIDTGNFTPDELIQKRLERNQLLTNAESYLQRALQISPKLVDDDGESWWGVLGGLYKRRGQIDEAIKAYHQATVVTPQSSYGYGNLAQLYMKQGEVEKMLETFEHVEQIAYKEADAESGNFWGYSDLVVSSYAIGKHEQARRALPVAMSIASPDSPYMLEGLVETLREIVEKVEKEKRPHIREAIEMIDAEMERRAAAQQKQQEQSNNGIDETVEETSA
jgi:tetratricopeptide (TPR) repeat protein